VCTIEYCCDRKSRSAYAQSFALWQQATIEFTCHDHSPRTLVVTFNGSQVNIGRASRHDHSFIACSRHIYVWCCSSRTSRSWRITQSTQHHRRGCNSTHLHHIVSKFLPQLSVWLQLHELLFLLTFPSTVGSPNIEQISHCMQDLTGCRRPGTEFARKLCGDKPLFLRFDDVTTSPCSIDRSTTFLQNWQNGRQIMEMMYFGDHGPNAPLATPVVVV